MGIPTVGCDNCDSTVQVQVQGSLLPASACPVCFLLHSTCFLPQGSHLVVSLLGPSGVCRDGAVPDFTSMSL